MSFVTATEARRAAMTSYGPLVESELRRSARASEAESFDIFLSHASEDAAVIAGVKAMLNREGLSVYVDWLEDPQLDRSRVTPATAETLRTRMKNSRYLLYASSQASSHSKWMPWELGYFDGRRPGRIGILPIVQMPGEGFRGLEYLGLYPLIERVDFLGFGTEFGRRRNDGTAHRLRTLAGL